jgi:hypothetical protein
MERSPMLMIGRINIMKMAKIPKAIYVFNVFLIKISITFFTKKNQL